MTQQRSRVVLEEIPARWYNIAADLPHPPSPPLDPRTHAPVEPEALSPLFPIALIEQEVSRERWIPIPTEILDIYRLWRPTPLVRAHRLEAALGTPARIFYKYEGVSPAGSHKPNTAIAQAYYNKREGVRRLATETGAGQWGSALSLACSFFGLECTVYMVRVSYEQKPYRRSLMQMWGASVIPSPSDRTQAGQRVLSEAPDSPGSLGIAISEAVEDAARHADTRYALGSVLNHVLLHQTVIGLEAREQMARLGVYPDVVIGCCGGGSNFGGIAFPFLMDKLQQKRPIRAIAVEPAACPTLTRGHYTYDFGDTARLTPLIRMYTLGHRFIPAGIHAGGLRYHGASALVSQLYHEKLIEARAYPQRAVFEAGVLFSRTEGILPAPEAAHAVRCAVDEALACKADGEARTILFCLSGHGHFDLAAYDAYLGGRLEDHEHPAEEIRAALADLPQV